MKSPIKIVDTRDDKQEVHIAPEVIKNLQLDVRNTRTNRRKIARKNNVPWDLYKKLELFVTMRIRKGLDPSTGKEINI